jgi:hypothetical protein
MWQEAVEPLEEDGLEREDVPEAVVKCMGDEGLVEREARSCVTAD